MIRKKDKKDLKHELEGLNRYVAMKGGPSKKDLEKKKKLLEAVKKLKKKNPGEDVSIGNSNFCAISSMVANAINNKINNRARSTKLSNLNIECHNNKVIWRYGVRKILTTECHAFLNKIVIKYKNTAVDSKKTVSDVYRTLYEIVRVSLLNSRQIRKNPFSKKELFLEIEKHIKKGEPKRALVHLKELKKIV